MQYLAVQKANSDEMKTRKSASAHTCVCLDADHAVLERESEWLTSSGTLHGETDGFGRWEDLNVKARGVVFLDVGLNLQNNRFAKSENSTQSAVSRVRDNTVQGLVQWHNSE